MNRLSMTALMLLAVTVIATAQPDVPPFDEDGWSEDGPALTKLNLTDAQKKTMREMRLQQQKELIPLRADLQTRKLDLRGEMMAEKPNMARINALVDGIAKTRAEMEKKQIAMRFKLRDQLTPEQIKIWDEHKEKRMQRFGEARHGMRGKGMRRERMGMRGPDEPCPPADVK